MKGTKTKNGYRQLGHIGNLISTHSYANCRQVFLQVLDDGGVAFHNCIITNDKLNRQNIIQLAKNLATEVLQLKKR